MKNVKFGVFFLGLTIAIGALVTSVSAQQRREVRVFQGGGQLGVEVSDLDSKATTGVKVDEVDRDGPADRAGIRAGDVVVEYDGERVRSVRQLTRLVQETPEGRSVAIALMRDGKRQTVNATPDSGRMTWNFRDPGAGNQGPLSFREMPQFNFDFNDRLPRRFEFRMPERGRLGVTIQSLTRDLEEYFGATNGGALVSSVTPDSAAASAGIKAGDVIVSVNGSRVRGSDDLLREVDRAGGDATIVVLRDKKELTLKAALPRR